MSPSKRRTKIQLAVAQVHSAEGYSLGPLFDQHDHSNDRPIYFSDPASLCASFGTKR